MNYKVIIPVGGIGLIDLAPFDEQIGVGSSVGSIEVTDYNSGGIAKPVQRGNKMFFLPNFNQPQAGGIMKMIAKDSNGNQLFVEDVQISIVDPAQMPAPPNPTTLGGRVLTYSSFDITLPV